MDHGKTTVHYFPFERKEPTGAEHGRPVLAVYEQGDLVLWHVLGRKETVVGREDGIELTLPDDTVSRRHARIRYENINSPSSRPRCTVEDLGSRNGTFVNGRRINTATVLNNSDRIFLGASCLVYSVRTELEIRSDLRLISMATTDALTGLMNRGWMASQYEKEFERAVRYKRPVSLLMLDLDDFKKVNDSYGHPAGDEVLRCVGQILSSKSRIHDLPGRYGGEEFSLLLPETEVPGAMIIAERLRVAIAGHTIEHDSARIRVTASIGVAGLRPGSDQSFQDLVARADQALYEAKRRGKNRVLSAD